MYKIGKTNSQRVSSKETNGRLEQSMIKSMLTANGIVDATDTVYTVLDIAKMLQRKECTIRRRIENGTDPSPQDGTLLVYLEVGTGGGTERYLANPLNNK